MLSFGSLLFTLRTGQLYGWWGKDWGEKKDKLAPTKTEVNLKTGEVLQPSASIKDLKIRQWMKGLKLLWTGQEDITFSYVDSQGERTRRKITILSILGIPKKEVYLAGFCHLREEERVFKISSIKSKILWNGKRYEVYNFLKILFEID